MDVFAKLCASVIIADNVLKIFMNLIRIEALAKVIPVATRAAV